MTLSLEELNLIKNLLLQYTQNKQKAFDSELALSTNEKIGKFICDFKNDCFDATGSFNSDFDKFLFNINYDRKDIIQIFEDSKQIEFDF